jgi:hypothetical protein
MNSGVVTAVPQTRVSWRLATFLCLAGVAAIVFVGLAALPYYLSASYGPPEYAPRKGWLMLHISGGIVAILTGPVQLCWTIPLLTTELVLQGRKILHVRAKP